MKTTGILIAILIPLVLVYYAFFKPSMVQKMNDELLEKARKEVYRILLQVSAEGWNPEQGGPGNMGNRYPDKPDDLNERMIRDIIFNIWRTNKGKISTGEIIPGYIWAELQFQLTGKP